MSAYYLSKISNTVINLATVRMIHDDGTWNHVYFNDGSGVVLNAEEGEEFANTYKTYLVALGREA